MINARHVLAAVSISCLAFACNKTFCNGTVACSQFSLDKCTTVSGCMAGPACDVRTSQQQPCVGATDQASCASPLRTWLDNACAAIVRGRQIEG